MPELNYFIKKLRAWRTCFVYC